MNRRVTLLLLAMLLCAQRGIAQHHLFSLAIADTNYVPAVSGSGGMVTLSFGNPSLDAIAASGPVFSFEQAYPGSTSPFLQQLYFLEVDDPNLAENIRLYDTTVFYYLREMPNIQYSSLPNDYYRAPDKYCPDSNYALNLIGAQGAWAITHGDSNVIIGVVDKGFQPSHPEFINERGTSQFYRVRDSGNAPTHGTVVAAAAAGGTNNGIGTAAIGWNCRLDVSQNTAITEA
jgi:subtilisin family serine protease